MAIWQFDFYIIPKENMDNHINEENIISWKQQDINCFRIDFLQQTECWSEDIIQYGNVDSTCIQYIYENEKLEEIICRLDLRIITKSFINKIIEYMNSINSVIYYNDNYIFPTYENILREIKNSKAFSFCENPSGYIRQLNNYKEE